MSDAPTLAELGWGQVFAGQCEIDEIGTTRPARVAEVQRSAITALTATGPEEMALPDGLSTGDIAVGDWVLAEADAPKVVRLLDRKTELRRGNTLKSGNVQLIAANLDTLFVTTSCNADFNPARIERYLALAYEAGIAPVVLLTKADLAEGTDYAERAQGLGPDLPVVVLNAKDRAATAEALAQWCGPGQTVALAGTSGVGKTTIANALTGEDRATQAIREDDARGRHTTTVRSLHRIAGGGWLIDTPGMRSFGVAEAATGIETTFAEIVAAAADCRFRDCAHETEPGCAVQAAIAAGEIDPARLDRFRKLQREERHASEAIHQHRARAKRFGKVVKEAKAMKDRS